MDRFVNSLPTDLIVAAATVPVGGPRAIVRLAGDRLTDVLAALVEPEAGGFAEIGERPRVVSGRLHPEGIGREWGCVPLHLLHWPGPAGPTGAPLAELQLPGSPPLVDAVIAEACRLGARLARPGEFSLRSFLAGRLDLVQAEAVLAVVDARTPSELSAALDRMAGGVGRDLERLRQQLLDLVADVEAGIDFADETTPDAVPAAAAWDDLEDRVRSVADGLADVMRQLAGRDAAAGELPRVVLVGRPNIGKSSLFNAVVGRAEALVADEAGTTRDWLAARLDDAASVAACLLVDVAGVAEPAAAADRSPMAEADRRAREEVARADVIVACHDAVDERETELTAVSGQTGEVPRIDVVVRCDRAADVKAPDGVVRTSSRTGTGLAELRRAIFARVAEVTRDSSPATLRMRVGVAEAEQAVAASLAAITAARDAIGMADEAVVAGLLHEVVDALGEVTGTVIGTDLLDRIFSRHCVGK
jgi:tRNA modification GTPase